MDSENKENFPPPTLGFAPLHLAAPTQAAIAPAAATTTSALSATTQQADATPPIATPTTTIHITASLTTANATNPPNATIPTNQIPKSEKTPEKKSTSTKVYRQRVHLKNSTQKHAPISPRGTIILLKDNLGLDKSPLKKGIAQPEKLKLELKDTQGNKHKRFFPEKDELKWDDSKWISDANKWRNQVLRRVFKHDKEFKGRGIRPKWGMREATSLKAEVKKKIEEVGNRRLSSVEWEEVTVAHNKRYSGSKVMAGERLIGGELNRTTQDIEKRTPVGIKALFERSKALKAFLSDLVGETDTGNDVTGGSRDVEIKGDEIPQDEMDLDDETEDDTPTKKQRKGERHSEDVDPTLEDPSDAEDEGQRPAGTQNGARLVSCA